MSIYLSWVQYVLPMLFIIGLAILGFHGNKESIEYSLRSDLPPSIGIVLLVLILFVSERIRILRSSSRSNGSETE